MLWFVVLLIIFVFQIGTILVSEFRRPSKTVAWLFILFIFPIIGFVMYYFLAKEYRQRRMVRRSKGQSLWRVRKQMFKSAKVIRATNQFNNPRMQEEGRLYGLLRSMQEAPITARNCVDVLTNAEEAYPAILKALEDAKDHIHLEYYIFRADEIGRTFQQLLIRKAREGVTVRVVYDGVGSYKTKTAFWKELTDAGVEVHAFLPPLIAFFDKRVNYRNHRKIVVVDGLVGFVGGINIGDEYLGKDPKLGFWRDTHLRHEGDAVYVLQHTFLTNWRFVAGQTVEPVERYFPVHACEEERQVQIIAGGPDGEGDSLHEMFFVAITSAKERVWITTPYFIPESSVLMALKTAALSGADVRIIFPGVCDSRVANLASLSYVEDLLEAGARVYQYRRGFMHAKTFIVDDTVASTGTANMDMRSFFMNFELNALLFDRELIERLERDFVQDLADSKELDLDEFERRPQWQKTLEALARMLSPLL